MTQDEILKMAKQSGLLDMGYELGDWEIHEFTTFAKLVADAATAKEREACAKFIEDGYARQFENPWREDLAAAIRARRDEVTYGETTLRGEA